MHDASEAYLMDIPSPVKKQLVNYKEIEKIDSTLIVLGLYEDYLEPFEPNKNYEGFVVSKKKFNI